MNQKKQVQQEKCEFMTIKKKDIRGNLKVKIDMRKLKGSSPTVPSPHTEGWEDRLKILVNDWVYRLVKFGEVPPKKYGFTIYECSDLQPFVEALLHQTREDTLAWVSREIIGEEKSVDELLETMGSAYKDLSVQVAYKEGYNKRGREQRQRLKGGGK